MAPPPLIPCPRRLPNRGFDGGLDLGARVVCAWENGMRKLIAALLLASTSLQAQDFANYSDEALRRKLSTMAAVERR